MWPEQGQGGRGGQQPPSRQRGCLRLPEKASGAKPTGCPATGAKQLSLPWGWFPEKCCGHPSWPAAYGPWVRRGGGEIKAGMGTRETGYRAGHANRPLTPASHHCPTHSRKGPLCQQSCPHHTPATRQCPASHPALPPCCMPSACPHRLVSNPLSLCWGRVEDETWPHLSVGTSGPGGRKMDPSPERPGCGRGREVSVWVSLRGTRASPPLSFDSPSC